MTESKKRILTGDNTTGSLHIGHYVGSLESRIKFQDEFDTIIILADAHALAYPKYIQNPQVLSNFTLEVAMDNMSVGIDPKKTTYFVESLVPEIYELSFLLSALPSFNRVMRNPTLKEEIRDKNMGDDYSMAFLNFPILMAADILCVKADLVPVGEDQLPHLELTRELARKFNSSFGDVFVEPKGHIGRVARLVGTDGGTKMTKSLGNTVFLTDTPDEVKRKIMSMYTDPNRIHPTDPGKVEGNPVFIYHDAFNPDKSEVADLKERYLVGKVGDVEVKTKLVAALNAFLEPIREKRAYYDSHKSEVEESIQEGSKRIREIASETLLEVRDKLGMYKI